MTVLTLSIQTAIAPYSLSLSNTTTCLYETTVTPHRHFTENIPLHVKEALSQHNFTLSDLNAVGVVEGPGSYTGLRIGISTAKSIAQCASIPIYKLTTFQALALSIQTPNQSTIICIPGRRNECIVQIFASNHADAFLNHPVPYSYDAFITLLHSFKAPIFLKGDIPDTLRPSIPTQIMYQPMSISSHQVNQHVQDCLSKNIPSMFNDTFPKYLFEPTSAKKTKKKDV